MRVLVAVVSPAGTCSLGFAVSLMRLQVAFQTAPNMQVVIDFVSSVQEAAELARKAPEPFDAVVAVRSTVSFGAGFVLRAIVTPHPFIVGVYPLPSIDWERVRAKAGDDAETMRFKGNTYNVDPRKVKRCDVAGYVEVPSADLGALVVKGDAVDVVAGARGASDEGVCEKWAEASGGKPILADLENPCASMGPVEFTGCVGFRSKAASKAA